MDRRWLQWLETCQAQGLVARYTHYRVPLRFTFATITRQPWDTCNRLKRIASRVWKICSFFLALLTKYEKWVAWHGSVEPIWYLARNSAHYLKWSCENSIDVMMHYRKKYSVFCIFFFLFLLDTSDSKIRGQNRSPSSNRANFFLAIDFVFRVLRSPFSLSSWIEGSYLLHFILFSLWVQLLDKG